jgi:hypothetical protein
MEVRNVNDLLRLPKLDKRINDELKGVNVTTTHRPDMKTRFKVAKVHETPDTYFFQDKAKDKRINVTEYFQEAFNIKLKYPNLPMAWKVIFYL